MSGSVPKGHWPHSSRLVTRPLEPGDTVWQDTIAGTPRTADPSLIARKEKGVATVRGKATEKGVIPYHLCASSVIEE